MSDFKIGFKLACGAYLGWNLMHAINKTLGERFGPRLKKWSEGLESNQDHR